MMELKELISKANDEVKEKVEKLDDKQTKALKVVANDVGEIKERQDEEVEARAAMEVRMKTLEDELKRVKDMNSKEKESRASSTEILNVNGECVDNTSETIRDILKNAKKVIGLAPISSDDILRLGREHSEEDEDRMMILEVKEYLRYELKIQNCEIEKLSIVKIWKQNKKDFDILYVEFQHEDSVNLCYRHTPRMRKEKEVRLVRFVPPQLQDRNDKLRDIEYKLWNGDIKFKTRIKNGINDLILEKKTKEERSWTRVHVDDLPPIDLARTISQTTTSRSPAEGRNRTTKRQRSTPTPPNDRKAAKFDERSVSKNSNQKTPPPMSWDIGRFSLDNARSPSLTIAKPTNLEKEFLFSPNKPLSSGIPQMKTTLKLKKSTE